MKKLSAVLMCMVAFLWAAPANAQFKWGLEGGVNLSKASIKGDGGLFQSYGMVRRTESADDHAGHRFGYRCFPSLLPEVHEDGLFR